MAEGTPAATQKRKRDGEEQSSDEQEAEREQVTKHRRPIEKSHEHGLGNPIKGVGRGQDGGKAKTATAEDPPANAEEATKPDHPQQAGNNVEATETPEDRAVKDEVLRRYMVNQAFDRHDSGLYVNKLPDIPIIIRRFEATLAELNAIVANAGMPCSKIMKMRIKIMHELDLLESQRKHLAFLDGRTLRYPNLLTLRDNLPSGFTLRPTHVWGLSAFERKLFANVWAIHTLQGAEKGVEFLKKTIYTLSKSPMHRQTGLTRGEHKSRFLFDIERMLEEWRERRNVLRVVHSAARKAAEKAVQMAARKEAEKTT